MFGHWSVCRVEGQRAFGGGLLVEDGDGLFPRGELGIVDLAQIKDMALNRASGSTATFHDAPVSVDLPVLLASMAAQEHRPTSYPEIRESRQGGRSALQRKSLAEGVQRIVSEENRRSTGANQRKPLPSSESPARAAGLRSSATLVRSTTMRRFQLHPLSRRVPSRASHRWIVDRHPPLASKARINCWPP